jgi:uncharacterized protein (TIGR03435 family)
VVSFHKADSAEWNSGFGPGPQGGLRARNDMTMQLLTFAFDVREYQLVDVPGWESRTGSTSNTPDRAEAPLADRASQVELDGWLRRNRQRMQAVLRDKLVLVLRSETREMPLYPLVVAKGGPKLLDAR